MKQLMASPPRNGFKENVYGCKRRRRKPGPACITPYLKQSDTTPLPRKRAKRATNNHDTSLNDLNFFNEKHSTPYDERRGHNTHNDDGGASSCPRSINTSIDGETNGTATSMGDNTLSEGNVPSSSDHGNTQAHSPSSPTQNLSPEQLALRRSSSYNEEIASIVLENAPGNEKYTSPDVQKEVLKLFGEKVRKKIVENIGNSKFCIMVDEASDEKVGESSRTAEQRNSQDLQDGAVRDGQSEQGMGRFGVRMNGNEEQEEQGTSRLYRR
ncbi:zinc finger MYM-type protein 1 [Artemisia annua]|uniref:Zinc finger MYM-type protein 1 n=1 Tax=Artemisia annua TaxID=35608 RepID=A0A2U1LQM4_ARTAN|nr:zinc finger MYM-type protein 1 [Artemisia annua]